MPYKLAILNSHPIQYFAPLYRLLAADSRFDVTVFFCSRQGLDNYFDPGFGQEVKWDVPLLEGYKHKFLPNLRQADIAKGFFNLINPSIARELRQGKFDGLLINGHNFATYQIGIAAAKLLGIPVLMRGETHLLLQREGFKKRFRKPIMQAFYSLCNVCLPIGTRNAEFYRHHGVSDDRLFLVPYTVDNNFFGERAADYLSNKEQHKADLGLPPDKPIILYASKLMRRKRPLDLVRAYQQIRQDGREATLVFVGTGEQESEIKALIEQEKIPDVYFMGFQNQTRLPMFYALADMFVLPSENEPWGLIINEVMSGRTPIITTEEVGATPDLVLDGETGFTFTAGDVPALAKHLAYLVDHPAECAQMGQQAYAHINTWNYDRCVAGVAAAFDYLYPNRKQAN